MGIGIGIGMEYGHEVYKIELYIEYAHGHKAYKIEPYMEYTHGYEACLRISALATSKLSFLSTYASPIGYRYVDLT